MWPPRTPLALWHRRGKTRRPHRPKNMSGCSPTPSVVYTRSTFSRRATTSTSCARCERFFIALLPTRVSSHYCARFLSRSYGQSTASRGERQEVCSSDAHLALQYLSGHFSAVRSLVNFFTNPTY